MEGASIIMKSVYDFTVNEVVQLRKALGLMQHEFAELLGLSKNYQKTLEYGVHPLSTAYLKRIDTIIVQGNNDFISMIKFLANKSEKLKRNLSKNDERIRKI